MTQKPRPHLRVAAAFVRTFLVGAEREMTILSAYGGTTS